MFFFVQETVILKLSVAKHWTRAVHEDVLPAVVNTCAAVAKAC